MPGKQAFEDAAKKQPNNRTVEEQRLVDEAYKVGMTDVKNLDHAAQQSQRIYG